MILRFLRLVQTSNQFESWLRKLLSLLVSVIVWLQIWVRASLSFQSWLETYSRVLAFLTVICNVEIRLIYLVCSTCRTINIGSKHVNAPISAHIDLVSHWNLGPAFTVSWLNTLKRLSLDASSQIWLPCLKGRIVLHRVDKLNLLVASLHGERLLFNLTEFLRKAVHLIVEHVDLLRVDPLWLYSLPLWFIFLHIFQET